MLDALARRHGVTIDRAEWIPDAWLPLVEELLVRLTASGWRHRRLAQVKEKHGSLRVYVALEGESDEARGWAHALMREVRERSAQSTF